ncbi:MAG: hypothetical protein OJF62_001808 [Pseudolabrys sp.]|nr:hypothetical protein [Pseudolabrys sp.]
MMGWTRRGPRGRRNNRSEWPKVPSGGSRVPASRAELNAEAKPAASAPPAPDVLDR